MLRTHKIGEVNKKFVGKKVSLAGWVETIRDHGNVIFIDLRDRYGRIQVVASKKNSNFDSIKSLTVESCILIKGEVKMRPKGTENKELPTGDVEVSIETLEVFNKAPIIPFEINDKEVNEDTRLKYRFLDLRSERMKKNMVLRSNTLKAVRDFFYQEEFVEIETPIMAKSTPEGARDYIVPSRNHLGKFYALPQSPQLFKQLSQVAGFDKYIQIARCFRDEDLRADRQPEFTQIDVEMSFIEQEDIIELIERMIKYVFKKVLNVEVKIPFKKIKYIDAIEKYGSDRPDLRKANDKFAFCWIVDFPLMEYNEKEKRYKSTHHPFTMPNIEEFKKKKGEASSLAYDLVLNGSEIAGGSIRIHDSKIQSQVFDVLKISKKEAEEKFGFLMNALNFGAPPHGGIAFGFDRLVQIMADENSIREVIAFPKNKEAKDMMLDAPSEVSAKQLKDVHISVIEDKKKKKN
ncbi:MAG: aspartate--tRNA ligase [Candidatus Pacearchaeota archaeon]